MSRWPRLSSVVFALTGLVLLAGCSAKAPYVITDYRYHQRGIVQICFDEKTATVADLKPLSEEICRRIDRTAKIAYVQPYQCSWTTSTLATYLCAARPGETPPPLVDHPAPMRHDPSLGGQ
jgi:hypothetical protein